MSRSVLIRLLAVSLLVASCSIAATAWLTTRSTRAQFTGDLERTLAGDNSVYNALVEYGTTHVSWDGVQSVIDSFGATSDRTITMSAPDGAIIASSDSQDPEIPADAVPTAIVDPLAGSIGLPEESIDSSVVAMFDLSESTGPVDVAESDEEPREDERLIEPAPEPLPAEPPPTAEATQAAQTGQATTGPRETVVVAMLDTSLPRSAFTLEPAEIAERAALIDEAQACAARTGFVVTVGAGGFGGFVLNAPVNDQVLRKLEANCNLHAADEPGGRYLQINAALVEGVMACLGAAGVDGELTQLTKSGLNNVVVRYDATTASAVDAAARQCRADTVRAVLGNYTAPPAQLFLTSPPTPQRSWLASAGGTRIVLALLIVLVVTLLAAALGARRLLRPIRSLTRATQRMTTGELNARVLVRGGDEIARLGTAFNTMADSLERNERQRKTLVSDIAHELRNPLANVRCQLEAAQDDLVRMDGELVGSLLEETLQLQHLIDDLQDLALADAGRLLMHQETTDVVALVAGVVSAHRATAENAGITITFTGGDPTPLWIDHVRIKQAVGNLVSNAIRYTPAGGSIDVGVRATADTVTISVDDTGRGISREDLPHLFDRFFRSDASRSRSTGGSGLGLAITRHLVEAHHGAIDVRSAVGLGSQFSIRLPVHADDHVASMAPA